MHPACGTEPACQSRTSTLCLACPRNADCSWCAVVTSSGDDALPAATGAECAQSGDLGNAVAGEGISADSDAAPGVAGTVDRDVVVKV